MLIAHHTSPKHPKGKYWDYFGGRTESTQKEGRLFVPLCDHEIDKNTTPYPSSFFPSSFFPSALALKITRHHASLSAKWMINATCGKYNAGTIGLPSLSCQRNNGIKGTHTRYSASLELDQITCTFLLTWFN